MRDLSGACLSSMLDISELYKWRSSRKSLEESDKRGDSPMPFLNCSMSTALSFRARVRFLYQLGLTN